MLYVVKREYRDMLSHIYGPFFTLKDARNAILEYKRQDKLEYEYPNNFGIDYYIAPLLPTYRNNIRHED